MTTGHAPSPGPTAADSSWTTATPEAAVERALAILEQERSSWTPQSELDDPGRESDHVV
jgi:hypothetical protein